MQAAGCSLPAPCSSPAACTRSALPGSGGSARLRRWAASPSSPDGYVSPGRRGRRKVVPMKRLIALVALLFAGSALAIDLDQPGALDPHGVQRDRRRCFPSSEDELSAAGALVLRARRHAILEDHLHRRLRQAAAAHPVVEQSAAPLAFIAVAFLFAGFVKGAIGVGLPTVVMGLLSIVMPPAQAAGLMVLPAIGTNIWQMLAGPALGRLVRRYAGMIVAIFIGTFATIGLMTRSAVGASAALGLVLAAYGAYALFARRFEVEPRHERWASPLVGFVTGMISGATGVFV